MIGACNYEDTFSELGNLDVIMMRKLRYIYAKGRRHWSRLIAGIADSCCDFCRGFEALGDIDSLAD